MKQDRILYWDLGKSTFVKKDLEILRKSFAVKDYTFIANVKWCLPFEFLRQFFIGIFAAGSYDIVVCQFASYHSLVPFFVAKLLGKKRVIVAGGTDCVAFPSIDYGNFQRPYLKYFTRKSFEWATLILPVDQTLIDYEYAYTGDDYTRQGYRNFVKNITAREQVIFNGYDAEFWKPHPVTRNQRSVITVGANLGSRFAFRLKGIDLLLEAARRLPDWSFTVIGGNGLSQSDMPANVFLHANVPNNQLPQLYSQHQYYAQLSMSEGFPNALAEAILCGCTPVVSAVGAMPMMVGDDRFILRKKDPDALVALFKSLETVNQIDFLRRRMEKEFTFERRSIELTEAIREQLN